MQNILKLCKNYIWKEDEIWNKMHIFIWVNFKVMSHIALEKDAYQIKSCCLGSENLF